MPEAGTPVFSGAGSPDLVPVRSELSIASKILLIRLRSLGDSILSLPLIEALHDWRPDLQLDVLIESPYASVFSRHPAVHETLVLRQRDAPARGGWSRTKTIWELRRRRYPVVVNLHGGTTSLVFSRACGARLRIGYEHYRSSWAYDVRIPAASRIWGREGIHTVEHLLTLLPWLGISVPGRPQGRLYLDEDARARARERLECHGIRHQAYLLMHPTATLFTKQWPPSHFARIGDLLHEQYGIPVIFTSAPDEIQVLREVEEHALARHRYWSDLALNELFALIDGCRLFVGNDSGPTHAAAALHKPVVVIWGSSNFRAWHPWGTEHELVRSDLPCMPCPGYSCAAYGKPRCILEITVEEVAQACNRILART